MPREHLPRDSDVLPVELPGASSGEPGLVTLIRQLHDENGGTVDRIELQLATQLAELVESANEFARESGGSVVDLDQFVPIGFALGSAVIKTALRRRPLRTRYTLRGTSVTMLLDTIGTFDPKLARRP